MPRRKAIKRRDIEPDSKFHDVTVARFINYMMRRGKKSVAEGIVYGALDEMVTSWILSRKDYDLGQLAAPVVDLFLRGAAVSRKAVRGGK